MNLNIARTPLGAMDVQELTSCILQFSTATIFDEIKLQSTVLGQQGQNSVTKVRFIHQSAFYKVHTTERVYHARLDWKPWSCLARKPWFWSQTLGCGEVLMFATMIRVSKD